MTRPEPTSHAGGRGMWICRNLATELLINCGMDRPGATVTAAIPPISRRKKAIADSPTDQGSATSLRGPR